MRFESIEKQIRLSDPVASTGDRIYVISTQNGLFPDPWDGHVPHEMWGVWDHPIKLLDGFWFGLTGGSLGAPAWLMEANCCRVYWTHTEFDYVVGAVQVTRRDFVPDGVEGLIVTLTFATRDAPPTKMNLTAVFRSDLRPAWLGDAVEMHDAKDVAEFDASLGLLIFTDSANPWTAVVGSDGRPSGVTHGDDVWAVQQTAGSGTSLRANYPLEFDVNGVAIINFYIAGSAKSPSQAVENLMRVQSESQSLIASKEDYYQALARSSKLTSPDVILDEAFHWTKINCQWLARDVPDRGIGAGAGLPEYPWWFGIDTAYAVTPMIQAGLFDLARSTLRTIVHASQNSNALEPGRVIHEMSTTGVVHNPGHVVETPALVRAVHQFWLWSGDRSFLDEMYPFCKQALLEYTLGSHDADADLCPSGQSLIETPEMHAGFECIDTATYTCDALRCIADIAKVVGDMEIVPEIVAKAETLHRRIREEWWIETEGLFADVRASVREVRERLLKIEEDSRRSGGLNPPTDQVRQALQLFAPILAERNDVAPEVDLHWLLRHWVTVCPLEVGIATPAQASRALARLESPEFSGIWGMYLHPDRHDIMSVNTGVLATSQARYGRMNQALAIVHKMSEALKYRMPGSISEALPDKWCFLQLWSALGIVSTVVEGFFGVSPNAGDRHVRIVPNLPDGWDGATLEQLRVGDVSFDITLVYRNDARVIQVIATDPVYHLDVGCYIPPSRRVVSVTENSLPRAYNIEQTNAGSCILCQAIGRANIVIELA